MRKLQMRAFASLLLGCCLSLARGQVSANAAGANPAANPMVRPAAGQLEQARAEAEQGTSDQSLEPLRALAAQQTPPVAGAARTLGLELYRRGKLVEAAKMLSEAETQDPNDIEATQLHGLTLYRLGQPAAAIPYLKRVGRYTTEANADANHVLGLCFLNAQQYDNARASFAAQFGLAAGSAGAYLLLAQELLRANLPELAGSASQQALALDAHLPLAHFTLGEVQLFKSDIAGALNEFEAERTLNPVYAPTYARLGDVYLRGGQFELAQEMLLKALSLDTSSTEPFLLMGRVLLRRSDPQTALLYLQHAGRMDPSSVAAHTMLGQAYRSLGEPDKAKEEVEVAARLNAANQLKLAPAR